MIDGTRANATRTPLNNPSVAPIPMAATMANQEGTPRWSARSSAVRYAETPTIDPTERSMLRVMITSASPAATSAVMEMANRRRLTKRGLR